MLSRARFLVPCFLFTLVAGFAPACTTVVGDPTGSSGSAGGSGSGGTVCSGLCSLLLTCSPADCTFTDEAAAVTACASACESGLAAIPAAEAAAVNTCFSCMLAEGSGSCNPSSDADGGTSCDTACAPSAYPQALDDWSNATGAAAAGNSALVCTNGRDVLAEESCSGGGNGETGCQFSCCNGTCGATPDVAISCQGTTSGDVTCSCTAGKAKGKVLAVTNCDDASSLDVWNTCGE